MHYPTLLNKHFKIREIWDVPKDGISQWNALEGTKQKDDQVIQMQALENSRSSLMKKIAGDLKMEPSGLTLKKLIQVKNNPYRENLSNCRKILLSNIQKINILSSKIKNFMDRSALSLKKSIAFIHSEGEKANSPYKANGQVLEGKLQSRMLSVDA